MARSSSWNVVRQRTSRLGQRAGRYTALRKAGAKRLSKVFRTGGLVYILHGARVSGAPTKALQRARA
eukprot:7943842-Pyramimonas_sp.AAC.1